MVKKYVKTQLVYEIHQQITDAGCQVQPKYI